MYEDLVPDDSAWRALCSLLRGKIKRIALTSCRRYSNGCPRRDIQLKNCLNIPGSVQTRCNERDAWLGLISFWC